MHKFNEKGHKKKACEHVQFSVLGLTADILTFHGRNSTSVINNFNGCTPFEVSLFQGSGIVYIGSLERQPGQLMELSHR